MSDALLQVEALATGYGEVQVLWGLSLAAARGRLTTLVGANGAGKTTMLRAVVGTLAPWSGRVLFKGEDVTRLPAHAKAARGLVLVPEGRQLFSNMTVDENLEMGAYVRGKRGGVAESLERCYALFPVLKEKARQPAGQLSGGQQQMVAIGRSLMSNPRVLLCDELSLGLAPIIIRDIYAALADIKQRGTSVVLVEQDLMHAMSVADRAYCFQEGDRKSVV